MVLSWGQVEKLVRDAIGGQALDEARSVPSAEVKQQTQRSARSSQVANIRPSLQVEHVRSSWSSNSA